MYRAFSEVYLHRVLVSYEIKIYAQTIGAAKAVYVRAFHVAIFFIKILLINSYYMTLIKSIDFSVDLQNIKLDASLCLLMVIVTNKRNWTHHSNSTTTSNSSTPLWFHSVKMLRKIMSYTYLLIQHNFMLISLWLFVMFLIISWTWIEFIQIENSSRPSVSKIVFSEFVYQLLDVAWKELQHRDRKGSGRKYIFTWPPAVM